MKSAFLFAIVFLRTPASEPNGGIGGGILKRGTRAVHAAFGHQNSERQAQGEAL